MRSCEAQRLLADIQTFHVARPGKCRLNAEGTGMTKHLEHLFPSGETRGREPIFPLIAEPSGFLTTGNINEKPCGAFAHFERGRSAPTQESGPRREPF